MEVTALPWNVCVHTTGYKMGLWLVCPKNLQRTPEDCYWIWSELNVAAVVSHIGDVQFIDYEYSGYNYLAYDIGNHFNEFAGKNWICEVKADWFY